MAVSTPGAAPINKPASTTSVDASAPTWRDVLGSNQGIAAALSNAAKQFRRVNGYPHLPAPRAALDATIATVTASKEHAAA